jgi:hypothetical protein
MAGFFVVGAAAVVALGVPLWAIIDASRRPASSFHQVGSDKSRRHRRCSTRPHRECSLRMQSAST